MDSVPVWAALLLALAPSVVALAALFEAGRRDRRRISFEREQALREERIGAYCNLLSEAYAELYNWDAVEKDLDAGNHAYGEVQLLLGSRDLESCAGEVMSAIYNLRKARLEWTGDDTNRPQPQYDQARWAVHTFKNFARLDLRLDEAPPPLDSDAPERVSRWRRWQERWNRAVWYIADRVTGRR